MDNRDLVIALLIKRNQRKEMCALTLDEETGIRDKIAAASLTDADWEVVEKVVYGEER